MRKKQASQISNNGCKTSVVEVEGDNGHVLRTLRSGRKRLSEQFRGLRITHKENGDMFPREEQNGLYSDVINSIPCCSRRQI